MWAALSGLANAAAVVTPGVLFWPLIAAGYGLLLPVLAILQVRHATVRQSGAILGTASGMATVTVGIAASASPVLVVPALFVRGIWWWTIGKMWWETGVLPQALGLPTMVFAVVDLLSIAVPVIGMDPSLAWSLGQTLLAIWSLLLALALWRARVSP